MVIRVFDSFEAAEAAEVEAALLTTGEQRIETVLELQKWIYPDAAEQRLIRICRIIEQERS